MGLAFRALASVALLTHSGLANPDEACTMATESKAQTFGQSMLQTKRESIPSSDKVPDHIRSLTRAAVAQLPFTDDFSALGEAAVAGKGDPCVLPPGAKWCEVRLHNLPPYSMAVYDWSVSQDWVSWNICHTGHWEDQDMSSYGIPGNMLDIGGNIGYQTFAFSAAGWNVTSFEPMGPNRALMQATMCKNPNLATRIHINPFGLGTATQDCSMWAPKDNVGDGFTKCGAKGEISTPAYKFVEIGTFSTRRLDQVLLEQGVTKVDLVKIDVEGYEYQVFAGAPDFLTKYHPRLIKSELWGNMVGSSGVTYLTMFETAGYKFFSDANCQTPLDAKTSVQRRGGIDVVMCLPGPGVSAAPAVPAAPSGAAAEPIVAAKPAVPVLPAVPVPVVPVVPLAAPQPIVAAKPVLPVLPAVPAVPPVPVVPLAPLAPVPVAPVAQAGVPAVAVTPAALKASGADWWDHMKDIKPVAA